MQLIIGNYNYSSWSLRGWLAMELSNIPYQLVYQSLGDPDKNHKLYQYSPAAKVPVLQDGETLVWDSLAIAEYLAERSGKLWPQHARLRSLGRSMCAEMHSGFSALRGAMPMNCRAHNRCVPVTAEVQGDISRIEQSWLHALQQSHGPWLCGKRFTLADAFYAPVALRFATYGVTPSSAQGYCQQVLEHPLIVEWIDRAREEKEILEGEEVGKQRQEYKGSPD